MLEQVSVVETFAVTETVEIRDWTSAHAKNVAQNSTDTCCRTLIRFNVARVIVALHFEGQSNTLRNLDYSGVFTGALQNPRFICVKAGEVNARGFI